MRTETSNRSQELIEEAKALSVNRFASGEALSAIYKAAVAFKAGKAGIKISRAIDDSFRKLARVNIVDARDIRRYGLIERGFTRDMIRAILEENVPSLQESISVTAVIPKVNYDVHRNYYVGLNFRKKEEEELIKERKVVWSVLADEGNFKLSNLSVLDQKPYIRIAQARAGSPSVIPQEFARSLADEVVSPRLPAVIELSGPYTKGEE